MGSPGQRFKKALPTIKHVGKQHAITYAATQDVNGVTYITPEDKERTGYVYVRFDENETQSLTEDPRAAVSVRCFNAADWKEGVPVILEQDVDGEWHVAGVDESRALDAFGAHAKAFTKPAVNGNLNMDIVPGWRFEPLRAYIDANAGGLNVIIAPGIYEFADDSYAWEDQTPINLATISVTSGMKRPVLIGIDPATGLSTTAYGDEVSVSMPKFTRVDYNELKRSNLGKLWQAGYERDARYSAFNSIYDLTDLRAFQSPGAGGVASGNTFMPTHLDFELTVPSGRQAPVQRQFFVVSGGRLIVDGSFFLL